MPVVCDKILTVDYLIEDLVDRTPNNYIVSHDQHVGINIDLYSSNFRKLHFICLRRLLQEQCHVSHLHCLYVFPSNGEVCGTQVHIVNLFQPFLPCLFS